MGKREYTAEQAYRQSVRPLAAFFAFGGVLLFVILLVDVEHIDFSSLLQNNLAKRTIFGGIGILCMFIGVGLYFATKPVFSRGTGRTWRFRFSSRTLLLVFVAIGFALSLFYYVFVPELKRPLRSSECQLLATLPGEFEVTALTFSPDGAILMSGHADGSLKWWDYRRGRLLRTIHLKKSAPPGRGVDAIAFSPDGERVAATASGDHIMNVWDTDTGRVVQSIRCRDIPTSVCFSPKGDCVAFCEGVSKACLVDSKTWKPRSSVGLKSTYLPRLYFTPDGECLVILESTSADTTPLSASRMVMVDLQTGKQQWSVGGSFFCSVAFSNDGATLLTLSCDQSIALWNTSDGSSAGSLPHDLFMRGWLSNAVWLDGDRQVLSGLSLSLESRWTNLWSALTGSDVMLGAGEVVAWDTKTKALRTIIEDPLPIQVLAVSTRTGVCATGSFNGAIRIWRLAFHNNGGGGLPAKKTTSSNAPEGTSE